MKESEHSFLNSFPQGKTKKELSIATGIKLQSLHKAFERKSEVSAENAVKIAKALNTTVEYLVVGQKLNSNNENSQNLFKYSKTLSALDSLPEKTRENIEKLIQDLANQHEKT